MIYRLLTAEDDSTFCHKVSLALSRGWQLHGSPSITFDPASDRRWCAQAVVKDVPYEEGMKLGDA